VKRVRPFEAFHCKVCDEFHATVGGHGLEFIILRCLRQLLGGKSDTLSVQVCHPGLKTAWLHSVGEGNDNPGRSRSMARDISVCITAV